MDPTRFDALAKTVGQSHSRRTVLTALGAAALGAIGLRRRSARAQATPTAVVARHELAANNATLFVQTARGGTMAPNPQAGQPLASPPAAPSAPGATPVAAVHGAYLLTLHGHSGETIAFSDRPARDYGEVATGQFFTALGFLPTNPPNAALVVDTPQQQGAVVLVELLAPRYEAASQTLTYEANLLHQYPNAKSDGLAALAANAQRTPPAAFTNASLFIDDCPDIQLECYDVNNPSNIVGWTTAGTCYQWWPPGCLLCQNTCITCNANVPACGGQCCGECPGGCPTE